MARGCIVTVELVSVFYSGKNIGKEWEFTLAITPPGKSIHVPKHTLNHNTTEYYNLDVVKRMHVSGDAGPQLKMLITAKEHDWLVDDVVNHRVLTPVYELTDEPVTHSFFTRFLIDEKPVVIPRIAKLEFRFAITMQSVNQ
ncbi:MAG: hypothetical protein HKN70_11995 [Gammaproteobacteria bacterium]|nr:hypothetical protein [Gammaproteobacteria bacterium]